jgi:hypothetical protein
MSFSISLDCLSLYLSLDCFTRYVLFL